VVGVLGAQKANIGEHYDMRPLSAPVLDAQRVTKFAPVRSSTPQMVPRKAGLGCGEVEHLEGTKPSDVGIEVVNALGFLEASGDLDQRHG
jgi:hypothetical protein